METKRLPILMSIPHGGLEVPVEIADRIAIDETDVYNDCDLWAERLFDLDAAPLATVTTSIARVFVDANRDPMDLDDADGAVKTMTSYGRPIYRDEPKDAEKLELLNRYWKPFHAQLDEALRAYSGEIKLILDCHNMAQHGPSAYRKAGQPRPLVCLANLGDRTGAAKAHEPASCSPSLIRRAAESARRLFADMTLLEPVDGRTPEVVAINEPFVGGYILRRVRGQIPAMMIEINRGLFVGDQSATTPIQPPNEERIAAIRSRLSRWVEEVIALAEKEA